jgi:tripartite-type tricarboxylate transporter receptor subunit TctC
MVVRLRDGLFVLFCGVLCPFAAWAQSPGPDKPLRWIVPFPPGGIADLLARLIATPLGPALGQTVVVENRPGAGGTIGATLVAKGGPDSNFLLIAGQSVPTAPSLYKDLPFDPFKEIAPVVQIGSTPQVLVVAAGHPAKSVKDLLDMARANPGKLNYASVGNGSMQQLSALMLSRDAGVQVMHIPYKGTPEIVAATLGGMVDFMFDNLQSSQAAIRAGKLRALAFATRERDPRFAQVPTMIESGFPNFLVSTWNAVWTTAATPAERQARIETEIRRIIGNPEISAAIEKAGISVTNVGARELRRIAEQEAAHWARLLKEAGIMPQ